MKLSNYKIIPLDPTKVPSNCPRCLGIGKYVKASYYKVCWCIFRDKRLHGKHTTGNDKVIWHPDDLNGWILMYNTYNSEIKNWRE